MVLLKALSDGFQMEFLFNHRAEKLHRYRDFVVFPFISLYLCILKVQQETDEGVIDAKACIMAFFCIGGKMLSSIITILCL